MKVEIDCSSRMLYSTYYIAGLQELFGKRNVSFSRKPFVALQRGREEFAFEHYFAFIIIDSQNKTHKYIVDFCDPPDINETAYHWCDRYGKINFNPDQTDQKFFAKMVSLPPGFGIRIWNAGETFAVAISNLLKCRLKPIVPYKKFFHDYYLQYKRPRLSEYETNHSQEKAGYIFMIATLWESDETTNRYRKRFLETAKAAGCNVEGGFLAGAEHPKFALYKDWIFPDPYRMQRYIEKSKLSEFVFNTPAVHSCHGWKLGEFLAMGKAVISTQLTNALPVSLNHGEHLHLVANEEDLPQAVKILMMDKQYRCKLAENARNYYRMHASPAAVIARLTGDRNLA